MGRRPLLAQHIAYRWNAGGSPQADSRTTPLLRRGGERGGPHISGLPSAPPAGSLAGMSGQSMSGARAAARLCPQCGLCCNGVLFADVKLERDENPRVLEELGLRWRRRGRRLALPQPCAAFDGRLCRVYASRPQYCRAFECRLLQRVRAGKTTAAQALEVIARARREAARVHRLLRQCGHRNEALPLSRRYAEVMRRPLDLAGDPRSVQARSRLLRAMERLMPWLHRVFLDAEPER